MIQHPDKKHTYAEFVFPEYNVTSNHAVILIALSDTLIRLSAAQAVFSSSIVNISGENILILEQ